MRGEEGGGVEQRRTAEDLGPGSGLFYLQTLFPDLDARRLTQVTEA